MKPTTTLAELEAVLSGAVGPGCNCTFYRMTDGKWAARVMGASGPRACWHQSKRLPTAIGAAILAHARLNPKEST